MERRGSSVARILALAAFVAADCGSLRLTRPWFEPALMVEVILLEIGLYLLATRRTARPFWAGFEAFGLLYLGWNVIKALPIRSWQSFRAFGMDFDFVFVCADAVGWTYIRTLKKLSWVLGSHPPPGRAVAFSLAVYALVHAIGFVAAAVVGGRLVAFLASGDRGDADESP